MASNEFLYKDIEANDQSRLQLGHSYNTTTNNHYHSPSPLSGGDITRLSISSAIQTDFLRACHQGQYRRLERLLSKGADIDETDAEGCTALHYAALGGSVQTVEYLVAQGADINAVSTWYGSPLCLAAMKGHIKVVEALLTEGALINLSCMFLGSAAHAACVGGDLATLQILNAQGADFRAHRTTCIEIWNDLITLKEGSIMDLRVRPLGECLRIHHGSPGALAIQLGLLNVVDYCLNEIASMSVHEPLSFSQEWTKESLFSTRTVPLSHWGKDTLIMSVSLRSDDRTMRVLLPHDLAFKVQTDPSEFFTMGKVFSALRPRSASPVHSHADLTSSKAGSAEPITSEVRRFVVIYQRDDAVSCSCVPIIGSDEGQLSETEHAIVYTGSEIPVLDHGDTRAWNYRTMLKRIQIDSGTPSDVLLPMSRLNFGDISIIQHSTRVKPFGSVNSSSVSDLGTHFSDVWTKQIERIKSPISHFTGTASSPAVGDSATPSERNTLRISAERQTGNIVADFNNLKWNVSEHLRKATPARSGYGYSQPGTSDNAASEPSSYARQVGLSDYHVFRIERFGEQYRLNIDDDSTRDPLLHNTVLEYHRPTTSSHSKSFDLNLPEAEDLLVRQMKELETLYKVRENPVAEQSSGFAVNSIEAILTLIDRKSSSSGQAFTGKPRERFFKACKALDQHDILFSILPERMKCASVIYGAVRRIVSQCTSLPKKVVDIDEFLTELDAIITSLIAKLDLYPQARRQMKQIVVGLYTRIFELLVKLVKRASRSLLRARMMKEDIQPSLQSIRKWLEMVYAGISIESAPDMRNALNIEYEAQQRFRDDMINVAERYHELQNNHAGQQALQRSQLELLSSEAYQQSFADLLMHKYFKRFEAMGARDHSVTKMAEAPSQDDTKLATSDDLSE